MLLSSDGYGNAFAGDWHDRVGADLRGQVRDHGLATLEAAMPSWLAESAQVGGDDVTVALLHHDVPPPVVRQPPLVAIAALPQPAPLPPAQHAAQPRLPPQRDCQI